MVVNNLRDLKEFHLCLHIIPIWIKDNLDIFYISREAKTVFLPGPMVSFIRARKITSDLVRAKLHPLERSVGSRETNITKTDLF